MAKYDDITGLLVSFTANSRYPLAADELNNLYRADLYSFGEIFVVSFVLNNTRNNLMMGYKSARDCQ